MIPPPLALLTPGETRGAARAAEACRLTTVATLICHPPAGFHRYCMEEAYALRRVPLRELRVRLRQPAFRCPRAGCGGGYFRFALLVGPGEPKSRPPRAACWPSNAGGSMCQGPTSMERVTRRHRPRSVETSW
jgi:hypothetical protein